MNLGCYETFSCQKTVSKTFKTGFSQYGNLASVSDPCDTLIL